jgi:2-polyprenyl-3-methyl-5-hydroxy-6-metoxy-1,4-benzoquinol methylase
MPANPRTVEYPWTLKNLKLLKQGVIVLDVGCAESLLSHELTARKYRVVGVDLREYPFKNKWMVFIKGNILTVVLSDDFFDAIIMVSTIEHVGFQSYGQLVLDDRADFKVMKALYRALKPGGIIIVTTSYAGNAKECIVSKRNVIERQYDRERLDGLVSGYNILKEEYFYRDESASVWMRIDKKRACEKSLKNGLACLVLQKPKQTNA